MPRSIPTRFACLCGLAVFLGVVIARAQTCGAAGGDTRPEEPACAAAPEEEPASPRGETADTGTLRSIDLVTGNKYLREVDARWPDGLILARHYNSRNGFARTLGPGWSHSWDTRVVRVSASEAQVLQADGGRRVFHRLAAPAAPPDLEPFESHDPLVGRLSHHRDLARRWPWRWRLPDGREMHFDRVGRLALLTDPYRGRFELDYLADAPLLREVRHASGVRLQLSHDASGRLVALTHPDGRVTRYAYDPHGALIHVRAADGSERHYRYQGLDAPHALAVVEDGRHREWLRVRYDAQGRAIASQRHGEPGIQVAYRLPVVSGGIGESIVTHDGGAVSRYRWRYRTHEHHAVLLSAEGPGCPVCPPTGFVRRHDSADRLLLESWPGRGVEWRWRRDHRGRVTRWERWHRTGPTPPVRVSLRAFEYLGEGLHQPLVEIRVPSLAPGRWAGIRWSHDDQGRVLARTVHGHTPVWRSWDPRTGEPRRWQPIARTTRYGYEATGAARGRLAYVDGPLPGEADRTRLHYDERGRLARIERPEGLVEHWAWDAQGRLEQWRDPDGHTVRLAHGPDGLPVRLSSGEATARVSLDPQGVRWLTRDGERLLGADFAEAGAPQTWIDARGATHRVPSVDPRDVVGAGASGARRPEMSPAPAGTGTFDARSFRQWRNDLGDLVAEWSPIGGLILHHHDAAGRVLMRLHESGAFERLSHDALGRPLTKGDRLDPARVRWVWKGTRLQSLSDPVQTVAYRYDARGRLVAKAVRVGDRQSQDPTVMVSAWHTDATGRETAQVLPGGHALGWSVDAQGRARALVFRASDGRSIVLAGDIAWSGDGAAAPRLVGWRSQTGLQWTLDIDPAGDARAMRASTRTGPVLGWRVQRDASGRITTLQTDDEVSAFAYDARGRLIGAADARRAEGFAYDDDGRRRIRVLREVGTDWQVDRYEHDREGHLLALDSTPGAASMRFARAGGGRVGLEWSIQALPNPLSGASASPPWRGFWRGPHGRETAVFDARGVHALMDHDARGLRVRTREARSEDTTVHLHHQGQRVGEADAQGRLRRWFVRLGGWPLAELRFDAGRFTGVRWWLTDPRGAPIRSVDEAGQVRWTGRLSAFGEGLASQPPDPREAPALRLPGQWHDPATGLHENGWRSYRASFGRYVQPDPLGAWVGGDARAYAGHDPINRVDPLGLYEVDVHYYLTYFLARAAGVSPQRAYMVATAAQAIDDDPLTRPETPGNFRARDLYHFVMVGRDRVADASTRYFDPRSPQLDNLLSAARASGASECARVILFGEYLHTFEDAFAHRDENNVPFGYRGGHLVAGHDPDQTYDVLNSLAPVGSVVRQFADYRWNEERTLRMAQETYFAMGRFFGTTPVVGFTAITEAVQRFLRTGALEHREMITSARAPESDQAYQARKRRELAAKIAVLDAELQRLGLGSYDSRYADADGQLYQAMYDPDQGLRQRARHLGALRHGPDPATDPFRGVLLPGD